MVLGENKRVPSGLQERMKDNFRIFIKSLTNDTLDYASLVATEGIFDTFYVELPPVNWYYSIEFGMNNKRIQSGIR